MCKVEPNNKYKKEWEELEGAKPAPNSFRKICEIDYSKFENQVKIQNNGFVKNITSSFYSGDFFILKNAFSSTFINKLKSSLMEYSKKSPSTFFKMKEGCPDFHRIQNEDHLGKYSVDAVRHSFYFFSWNDDPLKIREKLYKKWRIIKFASGRSFTEWEKNTPKDGVVDRVQIVKYPPGSGYIEPHVHDPINQRIIVSVFMSEIGKDFSKGGCHFYNKKNQKVSVEDRIQIGDIGLFYASLRHCVDPVMAEESLLKNKDTDGRWWIGLYSPESDELDKRHTSSPAVE
tara:strand:- start:164 stop:1024 length:861 start_codon:yes stop_codon:yes gene_type:complete